LKLNPHEEAMKDDTRPEPPLSRKPLAMRRRPPSDHDLRPEFVPLRLVLTTTGTVIELTYPDLLVGRHSQADVRLPMPDVSRRHCRFLYSSGGWQVHDLQSLNGVYVNDRLVEQATLQPGDRLRIGGFTFVVESADLTVPEGPEGLVRRLIRDLPVATSNSHLRRKAS
jgi:hypothetical protein